MEQYWQQEIETADREQITAWQSERLVATVKRIYDNVPLYKQRMDEAGVTPDEFAALGTRVLAISRETRTINAYGYQRGDLYGMPEWCITLGMKQILSAKKVYIALNRPWQNGPLKHTILDAESAYVPASLLRRCPEVIFCGMEEVTKGIL